MPSADPRRGHLAGEIASTNGLDSVARCLNPARPPCTRTPGAVRPDSRRRAPRLPVPCAPSPLCHPAEAGGWYEASPNTAEWPVMISLIRQFKVLIF